MFLFLCGMTTASPQIFLEREREKENDLRLLQEDFSFSFFFLCCCCFLLKLLQCCVIVLYLSTAKGITGKKYKLTSKQQRENY